jgi:hypothetical protein
MTRCGSAPALPSARTPVGRSSHLTRAPRAKRRWSSRHPAAFLFLSRALARRRNPFGERHLGCTTVSLHRHHHLRHHRHRRRRRMSEQRTFASENVGKYQREVRSSETEPGAWWLVAWAAARTTRTRLTRVRRIPNPSKAILMIEIGI